MTLEGNYCTGMQVKFKVVLISREKDGRLHVVVDPSILYRPNLKLNSIGIHISGLLHGYELRLAIEEALEKAVVTELRRSMAAGEIDSDDVIDLVESSLTLVPDLLTIKKMVDEDRIRVP